MDYNVGRSFDNVESGERRLKTFKWRMKNPSRWDHKWKSGLVEEKKESEVNMWSKLLRQMENNQDDIQEDDVKKENANENQDEEDMEHSYKEAHTKDENCGD